MPAYLDTAVKKSVAVACLTVLILLTFKTESLWTDEAFSAYIACHRTFPALWHTLRIGDSSDLQMWLYYSYLHFWTILFGTSELAFRSANIPFVVVFSATVVWIRTNLFDSNWVWLAALSPMVWSYAGDARPYMIVAALSTVFVTCVVASFTDSRYAESSRLPWVGLVALFIGMNMHMLTILIVPPCFILVLVSRWSNLSALNTVLNRAPAKHWLRALLFLSPAFLFYFTFLIWTFKRGTNYDYAAPDLVSMGAVLYRLIGLGGFTPNRHYNSPFRPYVFGMVASAICMVLASAVAIWPAIRGRQRQTVGLVAAIVAGICEAIVLTFAAKQQVEVRHLSSLSPLVFFLLFSGWSFGGSKRFPGAASVAVIGIVWLLSDVRTAFLPEFRREDFRDAVAKVLALGAEKNAEIAVVADPAAVAYYGLSVAGPDPCFPLPGSCQDALRRVPWAIVNTASDATFWEPQQIHEWLQHGTRPGVQQIILISRSRHPMYLQSPWWPALSSMRLGEPFLFHGFFVYSVGELEHTAR